jgi:excisionase family DNA binding protein
MEELITTKQVQDLLQVDRITIYRMLKDGRINGVKVGNQWRFQRSEIEKLFSLGTSTKSEITSVDLLPLHCIGVVQDVFADIVEVGAVTTDVEGQPLTEISNSCKMCDLILGSEKGQRACISSWKRLAQTPIGDPKFFKCHAGFQYARGRIDHEGQLTSILVGGQFLVNQDDLDQFSSNMGNLSGKYEIDQKDMQDALDTVRVIGAGKQSKIKDWIKKIAGTFEILTSERAELLDRLKSISELSKF